MIIPLFIFISTAVEVVGLYFFETDISVDVAFGVMLQHKAAISEQRRQFQTIFPFVMRVCGFYAAQHGGNPEIILE